MPMHHPKIQFREQIMSQHNTFSNSGFRATQLPYEGANIRTPSAPMQEVPMRSQYTFEAQLGGPRATHAPYEQDSRGIAYRDLDHGRPGAIAADGSGAGNARALHDSQRGELLQQARQLRMVPVDNGTRYGQPEVLETAGQTSAWGHLSFADSDLVDQLTNGQSGHMVPEQPTFAGSPRSSLGRAAKPLPRTSESSSDDNLSTATTAVDSGR